MCDKLQKSLISSRVESVSCDSIPPELDEPEVQLISSCRAGNGYLLFQFVNESDARKGYVIEFEGVPNRSTSADAFGAAVRAVTGRPDRDYDVLIRSGSTIILEGTVTVDCD